MNNGLPYLLEWDWSELGDEEFFAYLIEFPGHEDIVEFALTSSYDLPKQIYFTGNFSVLDQIDFPNNQERWPIMSRSMLATLQNVGEFDCREIPIGMLDDTIPSSQLFSEPNVPNPNHLISRFVVLQLLDHLPAFDWGQSVYTNSPFRTDLVSAINKLVLDPPSEGFPPIFRISAFPVLLFVSEDAKLALEQANTSGVFFRSLTDYPTNCRP